MWYEILIEKEFIDYFSNDDNVFTTVENGEEVLAPTFQKYSDTVNGVWLSWFCYENQSIQHKISYQYQNANVRRAYEFCKDLVPKSSFKTLPSIWHSIGTIHKYEVDIEELSAEQCAILLMYPFFSRMGNSSWEADFQKSGRLKQYLLALQKKCMKD